MVDYVDDDGVVHAYRASNGGFATWAEFLKKMEVRGLTPDGREVPDPTPMEPPIGYVKPPDLQQMLREMVRGELLRRAAEEEGFETEEEADDFEIGEEDQMEGRVWESLTPYEQAELEGMSARRQAEAETAEVMTTPVAAEEAPAPASVQSSGNAAGAAERTDSPGPAPSKAPPSKTPVRSS